MKKIAILSICLLIMLPLWSMAQDKLPVPVKPESWVNDYA